MPSQGKRTGAAVHDDRGTLDWATVDEVVNRCANALLARDLGTERRVAVYAENAAETALAHLGGLLGSTSTVPVNFHLAPAEAAYILADSGADLVFVGPENLDAGLAAADKAGVGQVVAWRAPARTGVTAWEDWLAAAPAQAPPDNVPPRPNLLYTSGTTGTPKSVELPPA
ncbi:MAG: AMP-binding protein, partial [Acidimicrobiales bacterium]